MEKKQNQIEKLREESEILKKEIKSKIITYMGAAFGLIAGLAWNDAITSLIDYFFPLSKNSIFAKFIYAFIVTVIVVLISVYLVNILKTKKNNN